MRKPAISTPPPICRSKASTICALHFGQCGQTDEDEWGYYTDITLSECRVMAQAVQPSHGEMYYRDKTNNITIIEDFNSCLSHCNITFNTCPNGGQFATFSQPDLTLAQCQAHQSDHDPAWGDMLWTPPDGGIPFGENFNHCTAPGRINFVGFAGQGAASLNVRYAFPGNPTPRFRNLNIAPTNNIPNQTCQFISASTLVLNNDPTNWSIQITINLKSGTFQYNNRQFTIGVTNSSVSLPDTSCFHDL